MSIGLRRSSMARVVAVCGMPGSGKGEFANVLHSHGIPVLSMGDMVRAEVRRLEQHSYVPSTAKMCSQYDWQMPLMNI
jgi:adenylate kinase family enzyme